MLHPASSFLRADPFEAMRRMTEDFDRAFVGAGAARAYPAVNVWEGSEALAVTAELPGADPDDIEISVKDDVLTLAGERKPPEAGGNAAWRRRERGFGRFSRSVRLPYRVNPDNVEARMADGVLRVVLHKREEDKPRRIEVRTA